MSATSFALQSASTPRIVLASMQCANISRIRAMSIVVPWYVSAVFPFGAMNSFSGENDGHVVSPPLPSSISHPTQNSADPFITG